LSYLDLDETNGGFRQNCRENPRRIVLGKIRGNLWIPVEESDPDSLAARLAELRDSRILAQGEGSLVIDSAYERLCAGGHCIRSGQKL